MSDWPKNIGAITLFVEDVDRAVSFYREAFGLEPAFAEETDAMFRLENTLLFLTKSSEAPRMIAPAVAGRPGIAGGARHRGDVPHRRSLSPDGTSALVGDALVAPVL